MLAEALFGETPRVFCDIAEWQGEPVGFALWFYNFSTFRGRHGIYLEDLFVRPAQRGHGLGKRCSPTWPGAASRRICARLEWSVLDWNEPSIEFYKAQGAVTDGRLDDLPRHRRGAVAPGRPGALRPAPWRCPS